MDDHAPRVLGRSGSADRNCGTPGGLESAANGGRDQRGLIGARGATFRCQSPKCRPLRSPRDYGGGPGDQSQRGGSDSVAVRGFGASQGSCDGITNGSGSAWASCGCTCTIQERREPTSAMTVNEPVLGSSADGKGEEGIDRSFERTGTPLHLSE